MYRFITIGLSILLIAATVSAEAPEIEWERVFGGVNHDYAMDVAEIEDVGYVVVGRYYTEPYGGGEDEFYVVKTDLNGSPLWDSTFGGDYMEYATSVLLADNGDYLVSGYELSFEPEGSNIWVIRLNQDGGIVWERVYGGENTGEYPGGMCQLLDGNYLIAGNSGVLGWYFVKIDPGGIIINEVGADRSGSVHGVAATSDGGAIAVGNGPGLFLVKLNNDGDTVWSKGYGGSYGSAVVQVDDGGYAAVGHKSYTGLDEEFWLLRVDPDGNMLWQQHYGNVFSDEVYSLAKTLDGGFVLTGMMWPPSGTEDAQVWVVRTDSNGDTLWTTTFGGDGIEMPYRILQTADSGYIVAGKTNSSFTAGGDDMYLVKLGPDPVLATGVNDLAGTSLPKFELEQNYPNPFNPSTAMEFDLPHRSNVKVTIFNLLGQQVTELVNTEYPAGRHRVVWDGTATDGERVSSGVYFYRLTAGDLIDTKKMVLIK